MSTALFVSPHLDDVAFSCGGLLARLRARGWRVVLTTLFTRSVPHPTGFALACQTDKGLPPEVDYMALRREEDQAFCARLGVARAVWCDLPEAPHRGYGSAPALFGPPHTEDGAGAAVAERLEALLAEVSPALVLAPQALGAHVDHVHVARAVAGLPGARRRTLWYRDVPYAVRVPGAQPEGALPPDGRAVVVDVSAVLALKVEGVTCYRTQLGFQFGGAERVGDTLAAFHRQEARAHGRPGLAEVFLAGPEVDPALAITLEEG